MHAASEEYFISYKTIVVFIGGAFSTGGSTVERETRYTVIGCKPSRSQEITKSYDFTLENCRIYKFRALAKH